MHPRFSVAPGCERLGQPTGRWLGEPSGVVEVRGDVVNAGCTACDGGRDVVGEAGAPGERKAADDGLSNHPVESAEFA